MRLLASIVGNKCARKSIKNITKRVLFCTILPLQLAVMQGTVTVYPLTPGGAVRRLKNLSDIRRFLARVANELDSEKISEAKARTLAYVCSILNQVIKDGEIEQRLEAIERALKLQKKDMKNEKS